MWTQHGGQSCSRGGGMDGWIVLASLLKMIQKVRPPPPVQLDYWADKICLPLFSCCPDGAGGAWVMQQRMAVTDGERVQSEFGEGLSFAQRSTVAVAVRSAATWPIAHAHCQRIDCIQHNITLTPITLAQYDATHLIATRLTTAPVTTRSRIADRRIHSRSFPAQLFSHQMHRDA